MDLNDLTYKIRGAIFTVHNELGPGLLESVYEAALLYELISMNLSVTSQVSLPVQYKNVQLEKKLGILVNFNVAKLVDKESLIRIIN